MNVVREHEKVQVKKGTSPDQNDQRSDDCNTKQAVQDDQMTRFRVLQIVESISFLFQTNLNTNDNYDCAEHCREGKVFFRAVNDDDQRWCHNVTEGAQPDEAGNSDNQRHGRSRPSDSRVDIQSRPNTSPVIDATFFSPNLT